MNGTRTRDKRWKISPHLGHTATQSLVPEKVSDSGADQATLARLLLCHGFEVICIFNLARYKSPYRCTSGLTEAVHLQECFLLQLQLSILL